MVEDRLVFPKTELDKLVLDNFQFISINQSIVELKRVSR